MQHDDNPPPAAAAAPPAAEQPAPPRPPAAAAAAAPAAPAHHQQQQPPRSVNEFYAQWERQVAGMKARAAGIDWSRVDLSRLQPSDIGVQFGPMMSEEQFREYRKRTGGKVSVLKAPAPQAKKP